MFRSAPLIAAVAACLSSVDVAHATTAPGGIAPPMPAAVASVGVPDGSGGAIFVWSDASGRLLAQRVNSSGARQWPLAGVPVSTVPVGGQNAVVTDDGSGGVIVTWLDARSGELRVYAQHLDAGGAAQWDPAGVALNAAPSGAPDVAADGAGGVFVAWSDTRGATASDIYVQRISPAGAPMWTANGVALATTAEAETSPRVNADGAGGVIVSWTSAPLVPRTVLAQRVDASGAVQWSAGGVSILAAAGVMGTTTDGAGGIIAVCVGDSGLRFVAQRVTASGQLPWGPGGSVFAQFQLFVTWGLFPAVASDGQGGAFVAWYGGTQALGDRELYVKRLDSKGASAWRPEGVTVAPVGTSGEPPWLTSDGSGGALLAWSSLTGPSMDVYAQRVNAGGVLQWLAGGMPVCIAPEYQSPIGVVSDGAGGATVGWSDRRNIGAGNDVYAQHLSAGGEALWRANGAPVYLERIGQRSPAVVADGAGGVLAAWQEEVDGIYQIRAQHRNALGEPRGPVRILGGSDSYKFGPFAVSDGAGGIIAAWSETRTNTISGIYAQRMDSSDVVRWTLDGVLVFGPCELAGPSALCADGAGGVFVAYTTGTVGAQHVDANGALPWGAGGAVVSSATQSPLMPPSAPCVAPDGGGGVFVAWVDGRSYQSHCISGCGTTLYSQRLDNAGTALWTLNGILLRSPIKGAYGSPEIASDGGGGAFVVWEDSRSGLGPNLYGQHLDASGTLAWIADGLSLCPTGTASHPALAATASGHAILAWADSRSGTGLDLYAQHIGYPTPGLWAASGVPLCTAGGDQASPALEADGSGGALVTWTDSRNDPALDVYAQRIDATGTLLWNGSGTVVSIGPGAQVVPVIAPVPDGGAIVAWQDARGGFAPVIGMQRLSPAGLPLWEAQTVAVDRPPLHMGLALASIRPNPTRGEFTASFSLPDGRPARLEMLDISGRRVASVDVGGRSGGSQSVRFRPSGLRPGLYLLRLVHASGSRVTRAVLMP